MELEKNVSHLRRYGSFFVGGPTQRLRTGLISGAPSALGKEDLSNGSGFLERKSEGKAERADSVVAFGRKGRA